MGEPNKLEEDKLEFEKYKLWVDNLFRYTEQRQRQTTIYITINSFVLGGVALLLRETSFAVGWQTLAAIPLLITGFAASLAWRQGTLNYKRMMNSAKKAWKEESGIAVFSIDEDKLNPRDMDRWLPHTFMVLYCIYLGSLVVLLIANFL